MHGVIFHELQAFLVHEYGEQAWKTISSAAGLAGREYSLADAYPDSDLAMLLHESAKLANRRTADLLESFGEFIVPTLLRMYGHLLDPQWKALDVIEHTEGTIHTVVRVKHPGARPPQLQTRRPSPNEVILIYTSPRRLCSLSIGIGRGLGRHFKENLFIRQTKCMLEGAPECELIYKRA